MTKQIRNRHFFISDIILLTLAAYCSFLLRLEDRDLGEYRLGFVLFTGLTVLITPLIFRLGGVYTRYWRYASVEELLLLSGALTTAVAVTSSLTVVAPLLLRHVVLVPRSVPFIFLLLALVATAGPRLIVRLTTGVEGRRQGNGGLVRPVLVMGAGNAGRMIVRELRQNAQLGMEVVGFLDDDRGKHDVRIHGVPVLGGRHDIPRLAHHYNVEHVIIAMPAVPGKMIREIVRICEEAGVKAKTIPGIYELLGGAVSVNQLRNVGIGDLLRRAPIQTDVAAVGDLIRGKRVLITGGGGSIGSELCRQVLRSGPAELVIVGHGENSVFEIQHELYRQLAANVDESRPPCRVTTVIADIRFADRIRSVFEEYRPHIVFHAAAHKHVPLMELNPAEAITNNVLGTRNLLDAALAVDVDHFVMLSTDKAVNPTSIMGASKRAAELLVHDAAKRGGKAYVAVRFGNVLGSRGSVVHTFKQQIAAGGPVRITHPEMRRYFMTIPEAVQLVLQAAVLGQGGEVFVLDMGEPVKIMDLARDMIELSGLEVDQDIEIVVTGRRPGEKLFEELFTPGEVYQRTRHEKIFIAGNASSFVPPRLHELIADLGSAAQWNNAAAIRRGLQDLVVEYQPDQELHASDQDRMLEQPPATLSIQKQDQMRSDKGYDRG
jgi:FlaA1/EpsC-like NDP-sugar epimerase